MAVARQTGETRIMADTFQDALNAILAFRDARDWGQFHTPRQLSAALSIEASELQETMLWMTDLEVVEGLKDDVHRARLQSELADVLIYSLLLAHQAGIAPATAIEAKLAENEIKYPISLAKGTAKKYPVLAALPKAK